MSTFTWLRTGWLLSAALSLPGALAAQKQPAPPTNVNAGLDPSGAVLITWVGPRAKVQYRVLRAPDPKLAGTDLTQPLDPGTVAFVDPAAAPGTTYFYQVVAVYPDGSQGASPPVQFATRPAAVQAVAAAPAVPLTVVAPVTRAASATIAAAPVALAPQAAPLTSVAPARAAAIAATPVTLAPPAAPSTPVAPAGRAAIATPPVALAGPAPQNVHVGPASPMVHTLTWWSLSGVAGFNVYLNSNPAAGQWLQMNAKPLAPAATSFADSGIRLPGVQYRVTAFYADGRQGSTVFVYTNPPSLQVPGSFSVAMAVLNGVLMGRDVHLLWNPVAGAKGYRLFGTGQPPGGTLLVASLAPHTWNPLPGASSQLQAYLPNLPDGVYNWQLTADYGGAWQGAGLPAASITIFDLCAPPQPTVGPAPDTVYVSGQGGSGPPPTPATVNLSWPRVTGAVAYTVERENYTGFGPVVSLGATCVNPQPFLFFLPKLTHSQSGQVLYVNQGNTIHFTDGSGALAVGSTYRYRVTAFGRAGQKGSKTAVWLVK